MSAPPVTAFAAAWITDENNNVLLDLSNGPGLPYTVTALDPGMPAVRSVVNDAPGRSGTLNTTKYFGARAVTASFGAAESEQRALIRQLATLADPSRRFYLVASIPEWGSDQWRLRLVGDQFTMPLTFTADDITAGWQAPDGAWETVTEFSRSLFPGGASPQGLVFPAALPWSFGVGTPAGVSLIQNNGTIATPPRIRIYGPVTAPAFRNTTTGETVQFAATYTIPAGQYVTVDCAAGTILANDDPSLTRMNVVTWSVSDFWQLVPGNNQIAFTGSSISTVTQAEISWRERAI